MNQSKRKLLSLSDTAKDLLRRAAGQANGESAYVESVLSRSWSRWTEALDELRQAKWKPEEIVAACKRLGGHHTIHRLHARPELVAESLLTQAPTGINQKRWNTLRDSANVSYVLTSALAELAAEYAAENAELIALLTHRDQEAG